MSIRETSRNLRDRWPLEFDLAGIPRDTAARKQLLQQIQILEETPDMTLRAVNSFASDYSGAVTDINNPPKVRYVHQEFPKTMYNAKNGAAIVVKDEAEKQTKLKAGYQLKPVVKKEATE